MYLVLLTMTSEAGFHRTDIEIQRGPQKRKVICHIFLYSFPPYLSILFCLFFTLIEGVEYVFPLMGLYSVVKMAYSFWSGIYGRRPSFRHLIVT